LSYWSGRIPWISSGEVANCRIATTRERITDIGLANSNAKLYPRGTVLIAMIGEGKTRGQSAILDIEACTNQNAAGLLFDTPYVNPEYVWRWALSEYERNRGEGRGGNQPALNGQKVRNLPIPLPPREEQDEIVRRVDAVFSVVDTIEDRVARATRMTALLRRRTFERAFSGELVPTEAALAARAGRSYESAEELLGRLARDRTTRPAQMGRTRTPDRKRRGRVG